jgi:hypothetical protein
LADRRPQQAVKETRRKTLHRNPFAVRCGANKPPSSHTLPGKKSFIQARHTLA